MNAQHAPHDDDKLAKDLSHQTYAPPPAHTPLTGGFGFGLGGAQQPQRGGGAYNPYVAREKPLKAEFLFPEHAKKQRTFTEKLCYGTGITYLVGQAIGGAWGFTEFMQGPQYSSNKLRINALLNSLTRRGPFVGNAFGVLALGYNFCNEGVRLARGGTDDAANHVVAGVLAGALYKSTAGVRRMMLAGGVGGIIAGLGTLAVYSLAPKEDAPEERATAQHMFGGKH
eukprot:m.82324 g.82324  ORF g.82324 m.82324 type:complete len:226 (-) comp14911_c2_seq2:1027-1704(-)